MNIVTWIKSLIVRMLKAICGKGPVIIAVCRFGACYSLKYQAFRRRAMWEKINRNIVKMGSFKAFREAIIAQRDEAHQQLQSKMKKWYTLQKQVEFLNHVKPGS